MTAIEPITTKLQMAQGRALLLQSQIAARIAYRTLIEQRGQISVSLASASALRLEGGLARLQVISVHNTLNKSEIRAIAQLVNCCAAADGDGNLFSCIR